MVLDGRLRVSRDVRDCLDDGDEDDAGAVAAVDVAEHSHWRLEKASFVIGIG